MNTNTNTNAIRPSNIKALAELAAKTNRFLFIEGTGGAGKTSIVRNLAVEMGRDLYEANLNGHAPTEVIGYGKPEADGTLSFYAPQQWPTVSRVGNKPTLLFLDEVNDYDPAVRALLRGLFPASGPRHIGSHILGGDILVVMASNRRQDGTRAAVEEAPLTERAIKVTLVPDLSDWIDWYDTRPELASSGSHVPAFLRFGVATGGAADGSADHFCPPIASPYDGKPHPCPRTWEAVALFESIRLEDPTTFRIAVKGSVGESAALAYFAFLHHVDSLPDINTLKADPRSFDVGTDPSKQFALVSACLATATRGLDAATLATSVHTGGFDWFVVLLQKVRGDIREFGARAAVRKGIPLDEHPQSLSLLA